MKISEKQVLGLYDVAFEPATDKRGYLAKPFDFKPFADAGIHVEWKQLISQYTEKKNTVKGFHIQTHPYTEAKLIIPVIGRFVWISVDVRPDSRTFGQWTENMMCPDTHTALFATRGFAHGFLNFDDDTIIQIAADNEYSETHGAGFVWDDPDIGYDWPLQGNTALIIKDEHKNYGSFQEFKRRHCEN